MGVKVRERAKVRAVVCNQKGLHARAAAKFVKAASKFDAEITVRKVGAPDAKSDVSEYTTVCGTSILGLLLLAAEYGSEIEISADGNNAQEAVDALHVLVLTKFEESE